MEIMNAVLRGRTGLCTGISVRLEIPVGAILATDGMMYAAKEFRLFGLAYWPISACSTIAPAHSSTPLASKSRTLTNS
ncbi:MAG: hypothetical protein QXK88_08565 [Desulfurococcaceae archaeon]